VKTETLTRILTRLDSIGRFCGYVAMAMIVLMIGCMIWEVVARKGFNAPTMWATTTSYMFNGTIFLIGAAYTLRANQHVRIDFLSTRLPLRVQHAIHALFYLCIFLPALYMTGDFAITKALKAYDRGTLEAMSAWEPLIWPFLTGISIGLVSFGLQVAIETVRHLIGIRYPNAVAAPSDRDLLEG
jgi:TRAP-type mannitol/chloroaromatic compound transport system permease small subunit